ncbi:hypothetical protein [Sphingomonas abietis]|uniref:Antibiotic biosynthesis monooxygenase n=1 Tax=Sphingomonas abietis TaxID=3012344 RepID=A0ABY7NIR5_9SPHN|nr:hypothetical protein [Sphingomonas abietis]WBO21383.1 hypothetical protein PBT88_14465 [Sphingomonas abietis]
MASPIAITIRFAVAEGRADAAGRACASLIDAMRSTPGVSAHIHGHDGTRLDLVLAIDDQAAVDRHLAAHGPLYAIFEDVARVALIRVKGAVDPQTIAVLKRLTDHVEIA